MFTLAIISLFFNIVLAAALYVMFFTDNHDDKDRIIMQQQIRINELMFELSSVDTDVYLDEIIAE